MKVNIYLLIPFLVLIKTNLHIYSFLIVIIDFITDLPKLNKYNTLYIIVNYDLIKIIYYKPKYIYETLILFSI